MPQRAAFAWCELAAAFFWTRKSWSESAARVFRRLHRKMACIRKHDPPPQRKPTYMLAKNILFFCAAVASPQPQIAPGKNDDYDAARWILDDKLLKKRRYVGLGLGEPEKKAIAAGVVIDPLPAGVTERKRELERRLRSALDDKACSFAVAQLPPKPAGPVLIQKLPPRRDRKELQYDYKPNKSGKPVRFCELNFDSEKYRNAEDYVEHEVYRLEQKGGSESEQARLRREEREEVLERAAETVQIGLAPIIQSMPKTCTKCGQQIPVGAKRVVELRVELPDGLIIAGIETLSVVCGKCQGVQATSQPAQYVEDESWMESLTSNEREAIRLRNEGFNQDQIGEKMGKSQSSVSRYLKEADRKQAEARVKKLYCTGGA